LEQAALARPAPARFLGWVLGWHEGSCCGGPPEKWSPPNGRALIGAWSPLGGWATIKCGSWARGRRVHAVARLKISGRDAHTAQQTLQLFEDSLALVEEHLAALLAKQGPEPLGGRE